MRCMTYNQAPYIKETMDGFTTQETSFPFVCCIMDDNSTDGEQNLIRSYLKDYFEDTGSPLNHKITDDYELVFVRNKRNRQCYFAVFFLNYNHHNPQELRYRKFQYIDEFENNSDYIALCEGDDYWIDSKKLQKQVEILDKSPDCFLVYSKALTLVDGKYGKGIGSKAESFSDLLVNNCIPTLTVMYRSEGHSEYMNDIMPTIHNWKMGDYPLWLYLSHKYKFSFIDENTSVYRVLDNSASHFKNDYERELSFLKSIYDIRLFFCNYFGEKDYLKLFELMRAQVILRCKLKYGVKDINEDVALIRSMKPIRVKDYFMQTLTFLYPYFLPYSVLKCLVGIK